MLGDEFPISDYYKEHVVEGRTISRAGGWWAAVLLIADPKANKRFLALYRWQFTEAGWKTRASFKLRNMDHVRRATKEMESLVSKMY